MREKAPYKAETPKCNQHPALLEHSTLEVQNVLSSDYCIIPPDSVTVEYPRRCAMTITFTDRVLDDGRIEMSWDTLNRREWQRALTLVKESIPQNGRIFDKESKRWLIAPTYAAIYQNIKSALLTGDDEVLADVDEQLNDEVIANLMDHSLSAMPISMRKRANFAIKAALGLIEAPVEFCISKEMFGAWDKETNRWCYEDGRYSGDSPSEKDNKVLQRGHKRLNAALEKMDGALEKLDQDSEEHWKAKFRASMLEKFDYRCYACGNRPNNLRHLHMHRVTPGKDGGMYTEDNIALLCTKCHRVLEGESWAVIHSHHYAIQAGE